MVLKRYQLYSTFLFLGLVFFFGGVIVVLGSYFYLLPLALKEGSEIHLAEAYSLYATGIAFVTGGVALIPVYFSERDKSTQFNALRELIMTLKPSGNLVSEETPQAATERKLPVAEAPPPQVVDPPETSRERLEALDQALLFFSSFALVVISLTPTFVHISHASLLAVLAGAIILTTALPVYTGYMRGAIEKSWSPIMERIRGWVYLVFGTGSYLLVFFVHFIPSGVVYALVADLVLWVGFTFLLLFTRQYVLWIHNAVEMPITEEERTVIAGIVAAIFLSMLGFVSFATLGTGINEEPLPPGILSDAVSIVFGAGVLLPLLYAEFNAHHFFWIQEANRELRTNKALEVNNPLPGLRGAFVDFIRRSPTLVLVSFSTDKRFRFKLVIFAVLVFGGIGLASTPGYGVVGLAMITVAVALAYVNFWRHMQRTWARNQV